MTNDLGSEHTGKMKLVLIEMVKQVDRAGWEREKDPEDLV